MGSNPYFYFTPRQEEVQRALDTLRDAEFKAGRYDPGFHEKTGKYMFEFEFPPTDQSPSPGPAHDSIEAAMEASSQDASGTRSILDVLRAVEVHFQPVDDWMTASDAMERFNTSAPLAPSELNAIFGTETPSRKQVIDNLVTFGPDAEMFWRRIDRGHARHIIIYEDGRPEAIFFAGMSFD